MPVTRESYDSYWRELCQLLERVMSVTGESYISYWRELCQLLRKLCQLLEGPERLTQLCCVPSNLTLFAYTQVHNRLDQYTLFSTGDGEQWGRILSDSLAPVFMSLLKNQTRGTNRRFFFFSQTLSKQINHALHVRNWVETILRFYPLQAGPLTPYTNLRVYMHKLLINKLCLISTYH